MKTTVIRGIKNVGEDIIEIVEGKRLQLDDHVRRIWNEILPKAVMFWEPSDTGKGERRLTLERKEWKKRGLRGLHKIQGRIYRRD